MAELGKKLGKLSLAILENFVEGVLGEKFVDELRAPTDREIAIATALGETENLFVAKYDDKELSKALFVDLKQADRPILKDAVGKYFDHPTDPSLRQSLQKTIFDEFSNFLSKERIEKAVDFYLKLLTKELMLADEVFRDNIAALAIVETNVLEQRQVELLEQIAEKIVNQQATSQQVFRSLHQLPPPPADFTGREQLIDELLKDFSSHKGATISGLTGMGGIGKTALGLIVAHKIAENYPDGQIFLDLKGTTTPLSASDIMRHVILSFEPTADLRALDETKTGTTYQSVLHGKKVLLFLDNARVADQIVPLSPPDSCAVLLTSRWTFSVPGLQFHSVGILEENEANRFLLLLCSRINGMATEISKACGYLPLALRIAGSFLSENVDWTPKEYLSRLKEQKLKSLKLDDNPELNVEACFELSYLQLSESDKYHWRTLGVFPASFTRKDCKAIWEINDDVVHEILARFCRMSISDYGFDSSHYRLHDLLHEYAGQLAQGSEATDVSIKYMAHIQTDLSNLLSITGEFHSNNFDPRSQIAFGAELIKTDPYKAIEYYSQLLNFLFAMPWILNDSGMMSLAEISCNNLADALEKIGENDKAAYFRNRAWLLSDHPN